jgi:ABC-type glycerol-3-phosphate transport system substrate-binding protein
MHKEPLGIQGVQEFSIVFYVSNWGVPCINCEVKAQTPIDQSCIDLMDNANSINKAVGDTLGQEVFGSIWRGLSYIVTGSKTPEQVLSEARKLAGQ